MTSELPDQIGGCELVSFIGRGGMGEVWHAVQQGLDRPCVVKVILPERSSDPGHRSMFLNEGRITAQLQNARIVSVFDVGVHEMPSGRKLLYLVMERVDGVNLGQFRSEHGKQHGLLPLTVVVFIIRELLEALRYAHSRKIGQIHDAGVIHHDITPGNIMISSQGEVKLTDFGIARFAAGVPVESRPMGTLKYMAPERLMGKVTRQADLYSVGVLLHELLTGRSPLRECSDPTELRSALLFDPVPDLDRPGVPAPLDSLRRALLEKPLEKRLRSAEDGLAIVRLLPAELRGDGSDLRAIYSRIIGPPSTGLTRYLQQQTNGRPSFLVPLLESERSGAPQAQGDDLSGSQEQDDLVDPSRAAWDAGRGEEEDDLDELRTRRWDGDGPAAPPGVGRVPATVQLRRPPTKVEPAEDGLTQQHRRARPAEATNGGRVMKPLVSRKAFMHPAVGGHVPPHPEPESPSAVASEATPSSGLRQPSPTELGQRSPSPKAPEPLSMDRSDVASDLGRSTASEPVQPSASPDLRPSSSSSSAVRPSDVVTDRAPSQSSGAVAVTREPSGGSPSAPSNAATTAPEPSAKPRPTHRPRAWHDGWVGPVALLLALMAVASAATWAVITLATRGRPTDTAPAEKAVSP